MHGAGRQQNVRCFGLGALCIHSENLNEAPPPASGPEAQSPRARNQYLSSREGYLNSQTLAQPGPEGFENEPAPPVTKGVLHKPTDPAKEMSRLHATPIDHIRCKNCCRGMSTALEQDFSRMAMASDDFVIMASTSDSHP
jgi:hypothetical protein